MKYLAILKDSFREALDSKIIYVMFGISVLVILVVATMSFEPSSPEYLMQALGHGHIPGTGGRGPSRVEPDGPTRKPFQGLRDSHIQFQGLKPLTGSKHSPDSEFLVSFSLNYSHPDLGREVRKNPGKLLEYLKEKFALYEELDIFTIADVRHVDLGTEATPTARFEVHLKPAAATRRLWPHQTSLFFGAVPLGDGKSSPLGMTLFVIGMIVVRAGGWIAILIGVIITAAFIPNMLRKGTVDLLLVKPIHRWVLMLYKYIGGLTFIFLNTALVILGVWLALGLRSGVWANGFLLMIFSLTFYFAILYAVSTLFGVLTQSPVVSILMTCAAWFLFYIVGLLYHVFEDERIRSEQHNHPHQQRRQEGPFHAVIRGLYTVVPRTADLTIMLEQTLNRDFFSRKLAEYSPMTARTTIHWGESLTVSLSFIALVLALSCWWFATRDY